EQAAFTCSALDQYGHTFPTPAVAWSVSGGTITAEGLYTAGTTAGRHTVRAEGAGREAIAEGTIKPPGSGDDGVIINKPGKRTIRWRGTIPYQKWTNFYMKVLSRFASSSDLKLEVIFEVAVDEKQAQSKVDETRSGLKELGLDDQTSLS